MAIRLSIHQHQIILTGTVVEEIVFALGASKTGLIRRILEPVLRKSARKLALILAEFYDGVISKGSRQGAIETLPRFNMQVHAEGVERISSTGPLLLISNHPGGLDSLGLLSCIPRNDIKVLVSDVRLLHALDYDERYMIYVDFKTIGGMNALREAIIHLNNKGAILLFARGEVEPDPSSMPGAVESIEKWSSSIEIMLKKSPLAAAQILTVSGAILPRFIRHPLTVVRRKPEAKQKLAEILQMISSLYTPQKSKVVLRIMVSEIFKPTNKVDCSLMDQLINFAQQEMTNHINSI